MVLHLNEYFIFQEENGFHLSKPGHRCSLVEWVQGNATYCSQGGSKTHEGHEGQGIWISWAGQHSFYVLNELTLKLQSYFKKLAY